MILGIDEAGRGPVIGPLVMAGVLVESEKALEGLGIKDSKLLSVARRNELFDVVKKFSHKIVIAEPLEIDDALLNPSMNLNWLEAKHIANLVNHFKPSKVYVDCPSVNVGAFVSYLKKLLKVETEIVAEHKADLKYEVVGAASILAKVTRDREIEKIKKRCGDCGSGYPSDPKTKAFLLENYSKHDLIFRKTWETYKQVLRNKEQKSLNSF
jgi:ribonuclease HII